MGWTALNRDSPLTHTLSHTHTHLDRLTHCKYRHGYVRWPFSAPLHQPCSVCAAYVRRNTYIWSALKSVCAPIIQRHIESPFGARLHQPFSVCAVWMYWNTCISSVFESVFHIWYTGTWNGFWICYCASPLAFVRYIYVEIHVYHQLFSVCVRIEYTLVCVRIKYTQTRSMIFGVPVDSPVCVCVCMQP